MTKNLFHHGGIAGQALAKKSNTDYDVDWANLGTQNITEPNTDLNNYTEDGTYFFNNANTPENKPNSVLAGYLEVIRRNANDIKQTWHCYHSNNDTYTRMKSAGTWSAWKKFAFGGDLISATITNEQTVTSQSTATVALNSVVCSNGSDLSLNNNKIVCNRAGIVEISGSLQWKEATASGNMVTRITKNTSTVAETVIRPVNTSIISNQIATIYESVSVGDTISLTACNWTDVNHTIKTGKQCTRLNVRYIN